MKRSKTSPLKLYQDLVDGLVPRREGVITRWITEKGWPDLDENRPINELLARLSASDRELISLIARRARDGGIHDTLVYLQEQMDLEGLRLIKEGEELPVSPYDTGIFWDWLARADGEPWPEQP